MPQAFGSSLERIHGVLRGCSCRGSLATTSTKLCRVRCDLQRRPRAEVAKLEPSEWTG